MSQTVVDHIHSEPGICGDRPCIAGTRIRVQDVYTWHDIEGVSPDEIVSRFPQLSLADVYAALTYYWDHRDEIQQQIKEDRELVDQMRLSIPSKIRRRTTARDTPDAQVPPG
jgi:uncharacterized protein (DUF433 family)